MTMCNYWLYNGAIRYVLCPQNSLFLAIILRVWRIFHCPNFQKMTLLCNNFLDIITKDSIGYYSESFGFITELLLSLRLEEKVC